MGERSLPGMGSSAISQGFVSGRPCSARPDTTNCLSEPTGHSPRVGSETEGAQRNLVDSMVAFTRHHTEFYSHVEFGLVWPGPMPVNLVPLRPER